MNSTKKTTKNETHYLSQEEITLNLIKEKVKKGHFDYNELRNDVCNLNGSTALLDSCLLELFLDRVILISNESRCYYTKSWLKSEKLKDVEWN